MIAEPPVLVGAVHVTVSWALPLTATISIKENEWEEVGEWMWKNKEYYNGLSVLPYDGHSYTQAPFQTTDEKTT